MTQWLITITSKCSYRCLINSSSLEFRFWKLPKTALSLTGLIPACLADSTDSLQPATDTLLVQLTSQYVMRGDFAIWKHR